jgi:hypothetical protein
MSYLFFIADKTRKFDKDGTGTEGTLGDHLDYLASQGGTPDCWDSTDTESLSTAKHEARASGMHLYLVDENSHRVVGEVNVPEQHT